jgi:hypothetical protein
MAHTFDSTSGLDVSLQPDDDALATPYPVWLDKISLTYW